MSPRQCTNHLNIFCYVFGRLLLKRSGVKLQMIFEQFNCNILVIHLVINIKHGNHILHVLLVQIDCVFG